MIDLNEILDEDDIVEEIYNRFSAYCNWQAKEIDDRCIAEAMYAHMIGLDE